MTKKLQKNLQDSKNSSIFASENAKEVSKVVFEVCSETPCDKWKPKEAMSIREMLIRSERGQRLDVRTRFRAEGIPDNMYQAKFDAQGRMLPDENEDTFDHTPPDDVNDIVDIFRLQDDTNNRKEELRKKCQKQKEELDRKHKEETPPPSPTPEDDKSKEKMRTSEEA